MRELKTLGGRVLAHGEEEIGEDAGRHLCSRSILRRMAATLVTPARRAAPSGDSAGAVKVGGREIRYIFKSFTLDNHERFGAPAHAVSLGARSVEMSLDTARTSACATSINGAPGRE